MSDFLRAVVPSAFLGLAFVLSLYIWPSGLERDHPKTIARRFVSAIVMTFLAPYSVVLFASPSFLASHGLWVVIGVRYEGLKSAFILPVMLTAGLFLGPIACLFGSQKAKLLRIPDYWLHTFGDLVWWRNHIVAPFTEELTFNACMVPLLLGYFSPSSSALISSVFFGLAHFHHMLERIRRGLSFKAAIIVSSVQMTYTLVFGLYSSFLFLRTGHLMAPVAVHGFCNFMGFPDIEEVINEPPKRRLILGGFYVTGVIIFFIGLWPMTDPELYGNRVYSWY